MKQKLHKNVTKYRFGVMKMYVVWIRGDEGIGENELENMHFEKPMREPKIRGLNVNRISKTTHDRWTDQAISLNLCHYWGAQLAMQAFDHAVGSKMMCCCAQAYAFWELAQFL